LIAAAVGFDQATQDGAPLLRSVRILHLDFIQATRQTLPVRVETERPAAVDRHQFIDTVRV
jgi:hypothetical protein